MGRRVGGRDCGRFARLDRRDANPALAAPVLRGAGPGVGGALRALDPAQERVRHAAARPQDRERCRVALRRSPGARRPAGAQARGALTLRGRARPLRHAELPEGSLRPRQRVPGRCGRRSQVRGNLEPHPRRHRQPRFRPGGLGPRVRQPDRLRGAARGEASVLRRRRKHLRVRGERRRARQAE